MRSHFASSLVTHRANTRPPHGLKRYRRPLVLAIAGSVFSEAVNFVVWALILYPQGSLLAKKLLWTIVLCGLGTGSVVGAAIVLFVVDRLEGAAAIAATSLLSATLLGGGCDVLCYQLDSHASTTSGERTSLHCTSSTAS